MADISSPALEKAKAKVLELVPGAPKVETIVRSPLDFMDGLSLSLSLLCLSLVDT
jgi:hypothetical protein